MSNTSNPEFASIADYRKHILQSTRYCYSQYGHIFAPSTHRVAEEDQRRDQMDEYMRHLYLTAFGASLLQVEVAGNRAIDEAISDGRVYEMEGIWATRVVTETFSYYTTDPDAEGKEEWLPFILDETYTDRSGNTRQKTNQKAMNLAFKKPLEGEVVAEVEERCGRWLAPVLDMFRRHWEVRETVEGQMAQALYFEYAANVQKVMQQHKGDDKQELRGKLIEALMDQYLLDTEEVRLTASQRHYTSGEIIEAARRAIHNFCVEQNRRLVELLGSKKTVSMFLEGGNTATVVYHTNADPKNWRSPMLSALQLVAVAERCFLLLADNDQRRSKMRMDDKAATTYAPVAHAETQKARAEVRAISDDTDGEGDFDERPGEILPFGLGFGGDSADEPNDPSELMLTDVIVGQGIVRVPYTQADIKALPYAAIGIEGDGMTVVHRWPTLEEATQSLRKSQAKLSQPSQIDALRAQVKVLHDPDAELGAEGSTRLLRTLSDEFKAQIAHQCDRYWAEWLVVDQAADQVMCLHRFTSAVDAALQLKQLLESQKAQLKPAAFKAAAQRLKVVRDGEGQLGATGTRCAIEGLQQQILVQIEGLHYAVQRGRVVICIPHLDAETAEEVNAALAAEMIAKARQARQIQAEVG